MKVITTIISGPQPSKTSPVPKWNTGTLYIKKLTDRNPFITIQRTVFLFLNNKYIHTNINELSEFPGSPMIKTPCFTAGGLGSILGQLGTKIPQAMRHSQTKKKKKSEIKELSKKTKIYFHGLISIFQTVPPGTINAILLLLLMIIIIIKFHNEVNLGNTIHICPCESSSWGRVIYLFTRPFYYTCWHPERDFRDPEL